MYFQQDHHLRSLESTTALEQESFNLRGPDVGLPSLLNSNFSFLCGKTHKLSQPG